MPERLDALQRSLEPLRERGLSPRDYLLIGGDVVEAVYDSPAIRRKYELVVNTTSENMSVFWEREGWEHVLQEFSNNRFLLDSSRQTETGINFKDIFLFGNPDLVMGGLAKVVTDTSLRERSVRHYLLLAKQQEALRRDDRGPRKRPPTGLTKATFRRTLLTIGEKPTEE